jgi:polyhydroxyalkanoate synthesis repressor PhaR
MAEETPSKRLDIRKYPNRRYYDSTRSRHVTLEEIYAAIRDGYEATVTDSKSGKDITGKVLAQIIIELDPPKLDVFPVALLHRLLRSNEQLVQDFVQKYFNQALDSFLSSQRSVEQYFRQAMGMQAPPPANAADWAKLMLGPFNPALWSGQQNPAAGTAAGAGSTPTGADLQTTVDELREQLASLQEKLAGPKRAKTTKKTSGKKASHRRY